MDVVLSKNAAKQYAHLPKTEQVKIKKNLFILQEDSLAGKKLEGELDTYRSLRAWPYRIVYMLNKQKRRVEVTEIIHRQGAYK